MTKRLIILLKQHWLAVGCALTVGIIAVLPQMILFVLSGENFSGLPFFGLDDEDHYSARIHEILDGHGTVASPVLWEYKNQPSFVLPIAEYFYALPVLVFKLPLAAVIVISKYIFPALLFLLAYSLIFRLTQSGHETSRRLNALAGGLLITLGYDFIDFRTVWGQLSGSLQSTHVLIWTRLVNPITGAVLLFSFVLVIWAIIDGGRKKSLVVIGGLLNALMVSYFFSWSLSLAILGLWCLIAIYQKKSNILKRFVGIMAISLVLTIPFWIQASRVVGTPEGKTAALRNGMFFTHQPIVNKVVLATTALTLILFIIEQYRNRSKQAPLPHWWWMVWALIGSCWLAFNQQIITGRMVWPFHYVQYTIPLCMVVVMVLLYNLLHRASRAAWLAMVSLILVTTLGYGLHSGMSSIHSLPDYQKFQRSASIFSWLNTQADKDCVVLVHENQEYLDRLIPAFTHCNVYVSTYTFIGVPAERIEHNYLATMSLRGIASDTAGAYLIDHEREVRNFFFQDWDQLFNDRNRDWLAPVNDRIEERYKIFSRLSLLEQLKKYRLDYLLCEKNLCSDAERFIQGMTRLQDFDTFSLYQIP